MIESTLIDTDIMIDYLRGQKAAVDYMEALPEPPYLSVVTVAELYAGVREGEERSKLDALIPLFKIIPMDMNISIRGGLYRRDYRAGHNVSLTDALIAATVVSINAILVTLNGKR